MNRLACGITIGLRGCTYKVINVDSELTMVQRAITVNKIELTRRRWSISSSRYMSHWRTTRT